MPAPMSSQSIVKLLPLNRRTASSVLQFRPERSLASRRASIQRRSARLEMSILDLSLASFQGRTSITFGKSRENDYHILEDSEISRYHFCLTLNLEDGCLQMTDLSSKGTYHRSMGEGLQKIRRTTIKLSDGDEIRFGKDQIYRYKILLPLGSPCLQLNSASRLVLHQYGRSVGRAMSIRSGRAAPNNTNDSIISALDSRSPEQRPRRISNCLTSIFCLDRSLNSTHLTRRHSSYYYCVYSRIMRIPRRRRRASA